MRGYSLHIAVNDPDSNHYGPNLRKLKACHNDAQEMAMMARQAKFTEVNKLLEQDATLGNVLSRLDKYAQEAKPGDLVFITYSGHGSQIPVLDPNQVDETDHFEETWCLYDTQLIDTEFYHCLSNFRKGVRVFILLDSCHSGTAIHEWIHESWSYLEDYLASRDQRFRHVSQSHRDKIYKKHRIDYENRQEALLQEPPKKIESSVCLISACQDNQRAIEDLLNGRFTSAVLFENNRKHTYRSLHKQVHKHLHAFQSPNLYTLGLGTNKMLRQPILEI